MQLFVGVSSHRGSIKRFGFGVLEMPVSSSLPKLKTLRAMREQRPNLAFALRLNPDVALVGAAHPDIARTVAAAKALAADVVVVPTGPRFTPTQRHHERLREMVTELKEAGCEVAWEPRGVWAPDEAERLSLDLGALLVRDLTREEAPEGKVVYSRVLPFGFAARMSQTSIDTLGEHLEGAERAYVIVPGEGAKMTQSQLQALFSEEES